MGSKRRIAKHILPIMIDAADKAGITTWIEPFVGGANSIDKVPDRFTRIGYDLNPHTIAALIGIRDHVDDLPDSVSEAEYKSLKGLPPHHVSSWVRFVSAFGAKFESSYAKDDVKKSTWHVPASNRSAIKQSPLIKSVDLKCLSYEEISPSNSLIYCDPPYQGTTGYKTGKFDHEKFFDWCRLMAKDNIVFISEYNAPDDFIEVWRGEQKTNFSSTRKSATHNAVEKLYRVMP